MHPLSAGRRSLWTAAFSYSLVGPTLATTLSPLRPVPPSDLLAPASPLCGRLVRKVRPALDLHADDRHVLDSASTRFQSAANLRSRFSSLGGRSAEPLDLLERRCTAKAAHGLKLVCHRMHRSPEPYDASHAARHSPGSGSGSDCIRWKAE